MVPANVMGTWNLDAGVAKGELNLEQTFQKINGTIGLGHSLSTAATGMRMGSRWMPRRSARAKLE